MSENSTIDSSSKDISSTLFSFLSSPDAMEKLGGILSKYTNASNGNNSPLYEDFSKQDNTSATQDDSFETNLSEPSTTNENLQNSNFGFDFSKIASVFASISPQKSEKNKEQTALLLAIRPYLSPRRKELIDSFIKINHVGEILSKMNQKGEQNVLQ
jgi:hypothetical protein